MSAKRKKCPFTLNIKANIFDFKIVNTRSFAIT
jgi:hypothetical protein